MQFMIMNYTSPNDHADSEAVLEATSDEVWGAYTQALVDAGILVGGEALFPAATATTLAIKGGTREIQDGPYASTKEQLGGFYVIEVADLETAIAWAARNPAAALGAVEIRQVVTRA